MCIYLKCQIKKQKELTTVINEKMANILLSSAIELSTISYPIYVFMK